MRNQPHKFRVMVDQQETGAVVEADTVELAAEYAKELGGFINQGHSGLYFCIFSKTMKQINHKYTLLYFMAEKVKFILRSNLSRITQWPSGTKFDFSKIGE